MDNSTTPVEEPKLNIKREEPQDLRIFFFIARTPEIKIEQEKCIAILSYDLETALVRASQESKGWGLVFHGQSTTIRELMERIYLDGIVSPPTTNLEAVEQISKEKLSLEQFKAGLAYAAEELVKNEEEKAKLKEMIKKL